MLNQITPVILTYNEAPNIARTLDALQWARSILVVDSFSSDTTLELARSRPAVHILQRRFDCFRNQWHYALDHGGVDTEWVLALDADYVLTPGLVAEIGSLEPSPEIAGYRARFRYCVAGKPLHGSLYPASVVLFRKARARYVQDGHAYRLRVESGLVADLEHHIYHDDRKPLSRWLQSQRNYARQEADKLVDTPWRELSWPDRVRRVPLLSAPLVAAYCFALKGCALDGRPGITYTCQRVIAELLLSRELLRRKLTR